MVSMSLVRNADHPGATPSALGTLFDNLPRRRRGDYGDVGIETSTISSLAEYNPVPTQFLRFV